VYKLIVLLFMFVCSSFTQSFAQDPMKPPGWMSRGVERTSTMQTLNLQQILTSNNRKLAIINDTLVVEGQMIGGAKVIEIADTAVKVKYKGRSIVLTMTTSTKEYNREK
jgi:hypothetical protein